MSLLRISDFSKLSRVSVKMLRHYDEVGLLKPARVDGDTDYRYYSVNQLPRLNRLLALKDLGFTLEQVARLLTEELPPEQIRGMLALRRAEIEQQLQAEQARLVGVEARLRQMESEGRWPGYEVVPRPLEPIWVASVRDIVPDANDIGPLFDEAELYVAQQRARAARPPLAIFYDADYRERDADIEVAVPVTTPLPDSGRVKVRELPAVPLAACVVHTGSYDTLAQAYRALFAWVEAHGYASAGPNREVYLRFGTSNPMLNLPGSFLAATRAEFVTELQLPIHKPDVRRPA